MKQYDNHYVTSITENEELINQVIVLLEDTAKESRTSVTQNLRLALLVENTAKELELLKVIIAELRKQRGES